MKQKFEVVPGCIVVKFEWAFMRQCSPVFSLISMHRGDHLLVGTKPVPIRTDPFAVHAVSE